MMTRSMVLLVLGTAAVSGCSAPAAPGHLGYGTPGVSGFMPPGATDSLPAEVARCRSPSSPEMAVSCAQLQTTMRNQPGNALESR